MIKLKASATLSAYSGVICESEVSVPSLFNAAGIPLGKTALILLTIFLLTFYLI